MFVEPEKTLLVTSDRKYAIELLPAPVVPVRNAAYVRKLAEWAVDSGAVLRTSCPVSGPVIEAGAVAGVVTAAKGEAEEEVRATIVADCTGISGALRRKTPRAPGVSPTRSPHRTLCWPAVRPGASTAARPPRRSRRTP